MKSIQLLREIHSPKGEWDGPKMTLVQSHKDQSPKEEWDRPKFILVRPIDQPKVE